MAKAYLCPHCKARNKFRPADIIDGVARCGACAQPFMLPDYMTSAGRNRQVTALIDHRTDILPSPATLQQPEIPFDPQRARAETLIVRDVQTTSNDASANRSNVVVNLPERSTPKPPDASIHNRPTIRSSEAPSLVLLNETPASSASTQPTSPPPEFRSLESTTEGDEPSPFDTTQPSHSTKGTTKRWWFSTCMIAILCGLVVTGLLQWLGSTNPGGSDAQWVESATKRATAIVDSTKHLLAKAQSEQISSVIQSHPDVLITAPSGRYFLTKDESELFVSSLEMAQTRSLPPVQSADNETIDTSDGNTDRAACASTPSEPEATIGYKLPNSTDASSSRTIEQWQDKTNRYIALPLISDRECRSCYGDFQAGSIITWITITGQLPKKPISETTIPRDLAPLTGGTVALFILVAAASLRRRRTA